MTSLDNALARLWTADDDADMLQQDGRWVCWGQVRRLAERIDRELGAAGCGRGGRVAVVLSNRMESVATLIALFRAERILVTVSPLQPPHRLSADLATTGASYVLAPTSFGRRTHSAKPSPNWARSAGVLTATRLSCGLRRAASHAMVTQRSQSRC
ncbi:AMP-binding enzyme family protein [Mycobacterium xenopi 4042]|uniref:AMP-binding enzyme family protein n=1 Tax=Mycobacterium xenopi 4042 TaxID=1299334 RepID=X8AIA5_MYCXE|nr:AMP-binding enzyme family protein [Mycobacterium xenopi 4042]